MDSSNLEETYDDESDVEDSEADDELKDEFEGVLKQVQNDSCHQQTDVRRGNKRSEKHQETIHISLTFFTR
jgi:hypothetical protein